MSKLPLFVCEYCGVNSPYVLMPKDDPKYPQCQRCKVTQLFKEGGE